MPTAQQLLRDHGSKVFTRGLPPCMAREAIYTAGYLGSTPVVKEHLMKLKASVCLFVDKARRRRCADYQRALRLWRPAQSSGRGPLTHASIPRAAPGATWTTGV